MSALYSVEAARELATALAAKYGSSSDVIRTSLMLQASSVVRHAADEIEVLQSKLATHEKRERDLRDMLSQLELSANSEVQAVIGDVFAILDSPVTQ